MQTPLQEGRPTAPVRGGPPLSGLGSNTSSANQLQGAGGSTNSNHVQVSGLRRRNIFSLGKSDQEKVRGEGVGAAERERERETRRCSNTWRWTGLSLRLDKISDQVNSQDWGLNFENCRVICCALLRCRSWHWGWSFTRLPRRSSPCSHSEGCVWRNFPFKWCTLHQQVYSLHKLIECWLFLGYYNFTSVTVW